MELTYENQARIEFKINQNWQGKFMQNKLN